jgi:hypothetical protein
MAVRRAAVESFGGFDELLGPGGRFASGEDFDLALRALIAGWHIYETDRTHVVHYGFRTYAQGRALMQRDFVGMGAAYAKPLRGGHLDFAPLAAQELISVAIWPPIRDLLRFRRPRGLSHSVSFCRGFVGGWRAPLDRKTLRYRSAGTEVEVATVAPAPSESKETRPELATGSTPGAGY